MHIHAAQPLFAWGCLDDCPTLVTIRDFLDTVPDQELLAGLRAARVARWTCRTGNSASRGLLKGLS